ncbi:MAG: MFS transporter, partial [Nocardioidaceae bacterium]|nr:MFS transporter [Nocardioidaceae bacterium]
MTVALTGRCAFRFWLAGATVSTLGDSLGFFALSWVAAGHGPGVASLVLTVESVPLCLLILVGGAVADRFGIRAVMIGCDAFMVAVTALFALGALVAVPVWSLVAVALLSGIAAALRRPAALVFPRMFATGDELSRTMATTTLCQQLAQTAGPSVGGVLLAAGGLALTAGVDATSFLLVLVVLLAVRPPLEPPASEPGTSIGRALAAGLAAARRTPGA